MSHFIDTGTPPVSIPQPDDPAYDLMVGLNLMQTAEPKYHKAVLYYDGRVDDWHANPKVAEILAKSSAGYPFRLASVPVNTYAERIRLTAISVDESVQRDWDDIYETNNMQSWSAYQILQTFKLGDSYLRITEANEHREEEVDPDRVEDEDAPADDMGRKVDLTYMSPFNTIVVYDARNPKLPRYAVHRWETFTDAGGQSPEHLEFVYADVYYMDRIEHWKTKERASKGTSSTEWARHETPDTPAVEEHDLGEIPIKHARTDFIYGKPLHEAAYGPHNAIMKLLVTHLATVDTQGWPVRLLLMDPAAVLDQANDNPDWDEENPESEVPVAEPGAVASSFREAPGMVQVLQGIKSATTFEAADPEKLVEPVLKMYLPMMAVTTRTPLYEFDPGGEEPSGKSRQVADGPINKNSDRLQAFLTDFWEEVAKAALKVIGKATSKVQVGWVPTQLASDKEGWEAAGMMLQAGVPFKVVMVRMGFDPVTVDSWPEPPKPWEIGMNNVPGMSSDPLGQRGGANLNSNPMKLGTNARAQEGPTT